MTATVTDLPRRALVYARVSTAEQAKDDATSLDMQVKRCEAYAASQGWVVAGVFVDGGVSGAKPLAERPQGAALLDAIEAGEGTAVVVLKVDRFTRSLVASSTIKDWERDGIAFASVAESFDTSTPAGRMMLNLLMVFAEFERDRIAERNADGRRGITEDDRYRDEDGRVWRWVTGQLPYGYVSDDETKRIGIDKTAAANVRRIFELRGLGMSTVKVAERLNDEGRKPRARGGSVRPFSGDLVSKILDLSAGHYLGEGIERRLSGHHPSACKFKPKKDEKTTEKRGACRSCTAEPPVLFAAPDILEPGDFERAAKAARAQHKVKNVGVKVNRYALSHRITHVHGNGSTSGMFGLPGSAEGKRFYRCSDARIKTDKVVSERKEIRRVKDAKPGEPKTEQTGRTILVYATKCDGLGMLQSQRVTSVNADLVEAAFLRGIYQATPEDWETFLKAKEEATKVETRDVDVDALRADLVRLRRQRDGYLDQEASGLIDRETLVSKLATIDARLDGIEAIIEGDEAEAATLDDIREAIASLSNMVFDPSVFDLPEGLDPVAAADLLKGREREDRILYTTKTDYPKGTDGALVAAVLKTLETEPDRYGRSPMLPGWVVEAAAKWATALDVEIFISANEEDPRRPKLTVELSGQALHSPGVSAWRTSCLDRGA